jgi:hypothetical protein
MNTVYLDDADDPVDIRYDNVFKAVFTRNTPHPGPPCPGSSLPLPTAP